VQAKKAAIPTEALSNQARRFADRAYTKQKAYTETIPSMIASEALEAKKSPCSKAKKKATGPDVKGNPISQPPTDVPQRRPARLTAAMNVGTSTSLSRNVTQSMFSIEDPEHLLLLDSSKKRLRRLSN
jgi:hypothetical protein